MENTFLPVFAVNRLNLLKKLQDNLNGEYGILATALESDNFLKILQDLGKTYFLDSGVFEEYVAPSYYQFKCSWYKQPDCKFENDRWFREPVLANKDKLIQKIRGIINRCDEFTPSFLFAPDIVGEPLLSLHLARLAWQEYSQRPREFKLIGVVQVGDALYNWQNRQPIPQKDALPPHYNSPRSFLSSLISEYRNIGYQYIALGGLLKSDPTMPTGLKFGLSNEQLDDLLTWSRPDFVLGGLALTRLEVLKKHNVWADSTNWLWWDARYDYQRFGHRNALQEVVEPPIPQTVAG
ncbi:MAG: hypothetical protein IGS50_18290 [Synechococcales cyanobacterium C42_A2020_086]|jgi:hypothetical protein|nr:hypothetical protein [Synechococcales cyanobacterium C42_A2020_086]